MLRLARYYKYQANMRRIALLNLILKRCCKYQPDKACKWRYWRLLPYHSMFLEGMVCMRYLVHCCRYLAHKQCMMSLLLTLFLVRMVGKYQLR